MAKYQVVCLGPCGQSLYEGDDPPGDARALLAGFADAECPAGGAAGGCPNTTEAREAAEEERPGRLRQLIRAVQNRAPRSARVPIPALTANTPTEIAVTWPVEMPDTSYSVTAIPVHGPALLAAGIRVCVKPGTLTTAGCVLIVAATQAVAAGQAGLHVSATP